MHVRAASMTPPARFLALEPRPMGRLPPGDPAPVRPRTLADLEPVRTGPAPLASGHPPF